MEIENGFDRRSHVAKSTAGTVAEYLAALPAHRRALVSALRAAIRNHLPKGYEETMLWGAISYVIPLSRHADTYNGMPLYYWVKDLKPGDTTGQNVGKVWFIVNPSDKAPANFPTSGTSTTTAPAAVTPTPYTKSAY